MESRRKLREGYGKGMMKIDPIETDSEEIVRTVIFNEEDNDWWPENLAPAECFEESPTRKFCDGDVVFVSGCIGSCTIIGAELIDGKWLYNLNVPLIPFGITRLEETRIEIATERPKPKFCKGQQVRVCDGRISTVECSVFSRDWKHHNSMWFYRLTGLGESFREEYLVEYPSNPKPKFEVGQWVECESDPKGVVVRCVYDAAAGGHAVVVRDPYGPPEPSPQHRHWVHPIDCVKPCAPVYTEAQLSIRVGDEVRVAHRWKTDGTVGENEPYDCSQPSTVQWIRRRNDPDGFIEVCFLEGGSDWLWNLEPVTPRA